MPLSNRGRAGKNCHCFTEGLPELKETFLSSEGDAAAAGTYRPGSKLRHNLQLSECLVAPKYFQV